MILIAIVVAEVLFWILLLSGLLTRYALKAPRIGAALLIATPIVDLVLLALTYIDLSSGKSSNFIHGLSALYIGYSIALGPTIIRALDVRFARRFGTHENNTNGPNNRTAESAMTTWKRACWASLISVVLLTVGIAITSLQGAFWLIYWIIVALFIVVLWWFIGPHREKKKKRGKSMKTDKLQNASTSEESSPRQPADE